MHWSLCAGLDQRISFVDPRSSRCHVQSDNDIPKRTLNVGRAQERGNEAWLFDSIMTKVPTSLKDFRQHSGPLVA